MAVMADHFGDPLTREAVSSLWPDGCDEDGYADASDDGDLVLTTTYGATVSYAGKRGKASLCMSAWRWLLLAVRLAGPDTVVLCPTPVVMSLKGLGLDRH